MKADDQLKQAIRKLKRPQWLRERLQILNNRIGAVQHTLGLLEIKKAKMGLHADTGTIQAIEELTQELSDLQAEQQALVEGWLQIQAKAQPAEL